MLLLWFVSDFVVIVAAIVTGLPACRVFLDVKSICKSNNCALGTSVTLIGHLLRFHVDHPRNIFKHTIRNSGVNVYHFEQMMSLAINKVCPNVSHIELRLRTPPEGFLFFTTPYMQLFLSVVAVGHKFMSGNSSQDAWLVNRKTPVIKKGSYGLLYVILYVHSTRRWFHPIHDVLATS